MIRNLILDLGGVIFDIDYSRTVEAFSKIGLPDAAQMYSQATQSGLFDQLEKGLIEEKDFYQTIRSLSGSLPSDSQIRDAWNALLIGVPEENATHLYELKKKYRLFLLSNTNSIHEAAYRQMITDQYGSFFFDDVFEKMYLSHRIHMRKPDREIFDFVIQDAGLISEETLFADDSVQHIVGAKVTGLHTILVEKGKRLKDILPITD